MDVTEPFTVNLQVSVHKSIQGGDIGIRFYNSLGYPLFTTSLTDTFGDDFNFGPGDHQFMITVPGLFLAPGLYSLTIGIHRPNIETFEYHDHALRFIVEETGSNQWRYSGKQIGNILVSFPWQEIS